MPVVTVPGDAAVGGVAMLAGLGAGIYARPSRTPSRSCVRLAPAARARTPATRAQYDERFAAWRELAAAAVVRRERLSRCASSWASTPASRSSAGRCPDDWAPIVRDQLGLRLVQHSLDLVDLHARRGAPRGAGRRRSATPSPPTTSSCTRRSPGLAAYSSNLLLAPDAADREAAEAVVRGPPSRFTADRRRAGDGRPRRLLLGPRLARPGPARGAVDRPRRDRWPRWPPMRGAAGLDYLVVENLAVAREPSTMAMIRELLDDGDADRVPIRLCLDVGHMCVPGTSRRGPRSVRLAPPARLARAGDPAPAVGRGGRPSLAVHARSTTPSAGSTRTA